MTDKERREGDALENLIQSAYDFSDEQLLAELEETEATLSDSDFPGIEDRIYQKLMARMREEERISDGDLVCENEVEVKAEINTEPTTKEIPVITPADSERKVVRFGKKKIVVVGLLAAAFVGMLGVTAIGGKNYFFRDRTIDVGVVFNNDKNIEDLGDINTAYDIIEEEVGINVLKLGYIPEKLILSELKIVEGKAVLTFKYDEKLVYYVIGKSSQETSIGTSSDRVVGKESISNKWISQKVFLEEETLENGENGYAVSINIANGTYRWIGQLPKEEIVKIIQNLNF